MNTTVRLARASRHFDTDAGRFEALKPLDLIATEGEYVGILGPSGSGKSTLLNLIGGIDRPSAGTVEVGGKDISTLSESQLAAFRGRTIGIVFQFFQLIPTLSVMENVLLAMDLVRAVPAPRRKGRARDLLAQVGVDGHRNKLPSALSGGEQQRVAIARALANDPAILIADEPTGNLDSNNSEMIQSIFESCAEDGRTVLVATHETERLDHYHRLLRLADGHVVEDQRNRAEAA
jgi:putative ABC transport system ATP-binding protein